MYSSQKNKKKIKIKTSLKENIKSKANVKFQSASNGHKPNFLKDIGVMRNVNSKKPSTRKYGGLG